MSFLVIVHVVISLVAIVTGFAVAYGFLRNQRLDGWNAWFLITTIATSASGFVLPSDRFLPSHAFGLISLVVLSAAVFARYWKHESGHWQAVYILNALFAFYLNMFVLVVQMFLKIPALNALAPTQSEPPFAIAQFILLFTFIGLGLLSLRSITSPKRLSAVTESLN